MQSLKPANDELDYIQLSFVGDLTEFEEEIEVEICDGEGEAETPAVQTQVVESSTLEDQRSDTITENTKEEVQKQPFCIFQQLRQLYKEELLKGDSSVQSSRLSSLLLEKLVRRENLNMVIINLNPVNKGYCLFISTTDGTIFQESRQPYSQDLLLDYIDHEELPPPFVTYWEQTFPQLFYSGCVIAQIKDSRNGTQSHVRHVLLKPHTQSLINDVNLITMDTSKLWTTDEKLSAECTVINTLQDPLCLDPSPDAGTRRFHTHMSKHVLNPLRNSIRKQSQVSLSRKRKMEQSFVRCNKDLAEIISNKKQTQVSIDQTSAINQICQVQSKELEEIPNWLVGADVLEEVTESSKIIERPKENECTPQIEEQYILESERPPNTTYHVKLSIIYCPSNYEYLGHLYVAKEYKEGGKYDASCRFSLGTRARANNYIEQFKEIFTEEGRKSVRITHLVPGREPKVTYTPGILEREAAKDSSNLRIHNHPNQEILQVFSGKSAQQIKVQKNQKDGLSGTLNGLSSSFNSASSGGNHSNGMLNGEIPSTPVSSPTSPQVSKTSLMANPAISALANSFSNYAQQYQQQAAAAAAASTIASSLSNALHPLSGSSISVASVNPSTNTISNTSPSSNPAILTVLSSSSSTNNQALNQPQQQKLVARKMTIAINSRLRPTLPNSSASSSAVRVPLSTLASQLTAPPQNQTININSSSMNSPVQPTVSVQTLGSNTIRPLKQGSVHTLSNIQTLTGSLPSVSGVQSLGNVQTLHRLTGTKDAGSVSSGGQSVPTSSLGLSMPGLSALLAGTPSAEDPSPSDRLNNSSQGTNLNLTSLQASMASIPGLQNVQVAIPGMAVPISMSLNVSTPHIVTASSLPSATDHC